MPSNRLVAASLEAEWNDRLRAVADVRESAERQRSVDRTTFDDTIKKRIRALAADFPAVWNDPATPWRERKRMVALLIEDATILRREDEITVGIRFRGGAATTVSLPIPLSAWRKWQTHPAAVARAAVLLEAHTDSETAALLNAEGFTTGTGADFNANAVKWLQHRYGLKSYRDHLRAAGKLTTEEMAARLGISPGHVGNWRRSGRLTATNSRKTRGWMYDPIEQPHGYQTHGACDNTSRKRGACNHAVDPAARGAV